MQERMRPELASFAAYALDRSREVTLNASFGKVTWYEGFAQYSVTRQAAKEWVSLNDKNILPDFETTADLYANEVNPSWIEIKPKPDLEVTETIDDIDQEIEIDELYRRYALEQLDR
jgi:hypothetical protein